MKDKYNKYNRYMTLGFGLVFLSIPLCNFSRYFLILFFKKEETYIYQNYTPYNPNLVPIEEDILHKIR